LVAADSRCRCDRRGRHSVRAEPDSVLARGTMGFNEGGTEWREHRGRGEPVGGPPSGNSRNVRREHGENLGDDGVRS